MLKINMTTLQVASLNRHLERIPRPPGLVAIPFPFDGAPTNDDGSPCIETAAFSGPVQGVEFLSNGVTLAYGIVRAVQKPGAPLWDSMVADFFPFDPRKFYVWVERTRGDFSGTPLSSAERVMSVANLVMQAVFSPGEKTDEGLLIEAITTPWLEIVELLKTDPKIAFQIPARKWEEIIAGSYSRAGFDEVILTPPSGDRGRDVIAIKRGLGSIRVIDQVKAYTPGNYVKANDIRALYGVLQAEQASSKGFLTTTWKFAPRLRSDPLIKPLIPKHIELIDGETLLKRLDDLAQRKPR